MMSALALKIRKFLRGEFQRPMPVDFVRYVYVLLIVYHIASLLWDITLDVRVPWVQLYKQASVLLVVHELSATGAVKSALELRNALEGQGLHTNLISLQPGPLYEELRRQSVPVVITNSNTCLHNLDEYDVIIANSIVTDTWIWKQVCHHGPSFLDKTIWYIREMPVGPTARRLYLETRFQKRAFLMEHVRRLVFVSRASQSMYETYFNLHERSLGSTGSLRVLPNPLSTLLWPPFCRLPFAFKEETKRHARNEVGLLPDDYVILSVGKVSRSKGSIHVLENLMSLYSQQSSQRKRLNFFFLGEIEHHVMPDVQAVLESQKHSDLLKLHFIGQTTSVELLKLLYLSADVLVVNSQCEAFGRVIIEAMSFEIPVIATKCGGPKEILVHGRTGFLYDTDEEMLGYVKQLLEHGKKSYQSSRKDCDIVQQMYSPRLHTSAFLKILHSVLQAVQHNR